MANDSKVPEEKQFYLHNGATIRSVKELSRSLISMPEEVFEFHVSGKKNDFANWIKDVVANPRLAKDVSKANSRGEMKNIIDVAIKEHMGKKSLSLDIMKIASGAKRIAKALPLVSSADKKKKEIVKSAARDSKKSMEDVLQAPAKELEKFVTSRVRKRSVSNVSHKRKKVAPTKKKSVHKESAAEKEMIARVKKRLVELKTKEFHPEICEMRKTVHCGIREFVLGVAVGFILGLLASGIL